MSEKSFIEHDVENEKLKEENENEKVEMTNDNINLKK